MKTIDEKCKTVIKNNTFYFFDDEFEETYEKYIFSIKETILHLKNQVQQKGCRVEVFEDFLRRKKELGLKALLTITGFSNESLKRLITTIRIVDDEEINKFVFKEKWSPKSENSEVSEWSTSKIERLVKENEYFRKALINIFFEGSTIEFFQSTLPSFELHKFSLEKLNFEPNALIDTLTRYKEKGSRAAKKKNNPEILIERILERQAISFEKGDLTELIDNAPATKRTMDFIIPNKANPLIVIESSFVMTTSSGQGDKSKTELAIHALIKEHYPKTKFLGFVDGIGWYVRKNDIPSIN